MILVHGKSSAGNVIHAIIGPESDLWSSLHGALTVDISPLLSLFTEPAPVILNISTCADEGRLAQQLKGKMDNGDRYPFLPDTLVFAPPQQAMIESDVPSLDELRAFTESAHEDFTEPSPNAKHATKPKPQADPNRRILRETTIHVGKCSRCPSEESELMPGIKPLICFNCAKIDLYYARKDKPYGNPTPTDDTV